MEKYFVLITFNFLKGYMYFEELADEIKEYNFKNKYYFILFYFCYIYKTINFIYIF